jgi:hypothetical protein
MLLSIKAIKELKIQSGGFSADYGHAGVAQINPVFKGSSNSLNASALENFRNRRLQLLPEFINALNRPHFDIPNRVFNPPPFRQIPSANSQGDTPPRQIQIASVFCF